MWIRLAILYFCSCMNLVQALPGHDLGVPHKFANLRRVQNRLDALDRSVKLRHHHQVRWYATSTAPTTTTTTAAADAEEDLFDTYGELGEDKEEASETSNKMKDEEDKTEPPDFEEDEEDRLFEEIMDDEYEDFQAEEPTEKPTTKATTVYTARSRLSQMKWDILGTPEKVTQERNRHYKSSNLNLGMSAASQHYKRVHDQAMCKIPAPKVISLQILHPNPRVNYIPTCTILHRCAEDTGCCKNHGETCNYKIRETVTLYVYSRFLDQSEMRVEQLTFYNDTECECKKSKNDRNYETSRFTPRPPERRDMSYKSPGRVPFNSKPESYTRVRCKCPEQFVTKVGFNGKCLCECDGGNEGCIRMQRGEEHLSLKDRRCILEDDCAPPHCEYGSYKKNLGRCPKFSEREEDMFKFRNSPYLNTVRVNK